MSAFGPCRRSPSPPAPPKPERRTVGDAARVDVVVAAEHADDEHGANGHATRWWGRAAPGRSSGWTRRNASGPRCPPRRSRRRRPRTGTWSRRPMRVTVPAWRRRARRARRDGEEGSARSGHGATVPRCAETAQAPVGNPQAVVQRSRRGGDRGGSRAAARPRPARLARFAARRTRTAHRRPRTGPRGPGPAGGRLAPMRPALAPGGPCAGSRCRRRARSDATRARRGSPLPNSRMSPKRPSKLPPRGRLRSPTRIRGGAGVRRAVLPGDAQDRPDQPVGRVAPVELVDRPPANRVPRVEVARPRAEASRRRSGARRSAVPAAVERRHTISRSRRRRRSSGVSVCRVGRRRLRSGRPRQRGLVAVGDERSGAAERGHERRGRDRRRGSTRRSVPPYGQNPAI